MKELHLLLNSLKHSSVRLNLKGWTVLILVFAPLISWTQLELTVIDQDQYPLVGVEVYNDDFSIATTTDLDGRVNLSKAQGPINFKYLGYEDLRI